VTHALEEFFVLVFADFLPAFLDNASHTIPAFPAAARAAAEALLLCFVI